MWCTRWFLPLLLLPLPTAPPLFLLLFLFSLTLHAKPCFYCIVLLSTLFLTSCYWQPFPLDTPLSVPWSSNITTFSHALNASISPSFSKPIPNVIRAVDRCWCDFSNGFFEPFNVSHWEYVTVFRLKNELERPIHHVNATTNATATTSQTDSLPSAATAESARLQLTWSTVKDWMRRNQRPEQKREVEGTPVTGWIRKEYDLRSYGFDAVVDFSW
ncbi:hypothetical protein F5887DRAFT_877677 [Amanita rubescens]|nr:hypothetical protein F5887DRAFT_877677 [Amanita rubescens]